MSQGASETLEDIGVTAELESGRYDNIRQRTRAMDRTTPEGIRAMRKLGVGPDYYVNSAHALTEDGTIVIASNTGSQLAPIAFGAGEVIFAIGTHKIVPDLETAFRRIEERSLPLENARMQKIYGVNSHVRKLLVIRSESRPGPDHGRPDQGAGRRLNRGQRSRTNRRAASNRSISAGAGRPGRAARAPRPAGSPAGRP